MIRIEGNTTESTAKVNIIDSLILDATTSAPSDLMEYNPLEAVIKEGRGDYPAKQRFYLESGRPKLQEEVQEAWNTVGEFIGINVSADRILVYAVQRDKPELFSFEAFLRQQRAAGYSRSPEEMLRLWRKQQRSTKSKDGADETLFDRLDRKGLIGCVEGGPDDLSSNPKYMEGFGET